MFKSLFGQTRVGPAVKNIAPQEVQARIKNQQPLLVLDVRQPEEFAYDGRIEGARLMPLGTLRTRINELPPDTPIVCVCRSGARSRTACEQLQLQGFTHVANLGGGMIAWKRAGLPYT